VTSVVLFTQVDEGDSFEPHRNIVTSSIT